HATATPASYTLSLHDALPICRLTRRLDGDDISDQRRRSAEHETVHRIIVERRRLADVRGRVEGDGHRDRARRCRARDVECRSTRDRKSTRLNSSHVAISYAVF